MESRLQPKRPAARGPGRGDLRGHGHLGVGPLVGTQLQPRLDQPEPVRLHGHGLAGQQAQDRLEALLHHVALPAGSMPIMNASEGRAPGPTPIMTRPRVRWSSSTMRSASMNGWW